MVAKPCPNGRCDGRVCTCSPDLARKAEIKQSAGRALTDKERQALESRNSR